MYSSDLYVSLLMEVEFSAAAHEKMESSPVVLAFETSLASIMDILKKSAENFDLIVHNDIHQACIHFDRERLAKSEKERERFDNMLSENLSARKSIRSLLYDPEGYRQDVEEAYAPYRKVLRPPAKEASITAYKNISKQIGYLKSGASSEIVKDYFTVRQDLLRADLDLIIELQCKALGLEAPKKSKSLSQDKGLSLER